jgi:hypothetical protein
MSLDLLKISCKVPMGGGGDMTDVSVEMSRMESVVCQMPRDSASNKSEMIQTLLKVVTDLGLDFTTFQDLTGSPADILEEESKGFFRCKEKLTSEQLLKIHLGLKEKLGPQIASRVTVVCSL